MESELQADYFGGHQGHQDEHFSGTKIFYSREHSKNIQTPEIFNQSKLPNIYRAKLRCLQNASKAD